MNKEELLLTDGEIQLSLKKANDEAQLYTSATEDSEPEPIPEKQVAIDQLAKVLPLIEQARQEERLRILTDIGVLIARTNTNASCIVEITNYISQAIESLRAGKEVG